MAVIQKYFLAVVPPAPILEKAHEIKLLIREQFGIKYALKSPPHITVKMPFNFNEAKEAKLVEIVTDFLKTQKPFPLQFSGVGTFGNRVIYLSILKSLELENFQQGIKLLAKRELHLVDELSDRNYHPHMTLAFKDLKPSLFSEVLRLVKSKSFVAEFCVEDLVLLKRKEGEWFLNRRMPLGV